jgi:lipopolysaccharide/colanic/teichoic acid biosynthesis glycosyltransferase
VVRVTSPGPIFFRQTRVGWGGRPFQLIKLRSMQPGPGSTEITAGDDARITPVGRWLRRSKLDELPELWNIVRGDMSFVGPRPEVAAYVDERDPLWREVLAVRPGLTDPCTLRLRHEEALLLEVPAGERDRFYRESLLRWKLQQSAAYLRNRSPWSDLRVLFDTARAVLRPGSARPPSLDEVLRAAAC